MVNLKLALLYFYVELLMFVFKLNFNALFILIRLCKERLCRSSSLLDLGPIGFQTTKLGKLNYQFRCSVV